MTCSHFKIIGSPFDKGGSREWNCTKCSQEFIPKPQEEKPCDHKSTWLSETCDGTVECAHCGKEWYPKPQEENPFDGEPRKGRTFTPKEQEERREAFEKVFASDCTEGEMELRKWFGRELMQLRLDFDKLIWAQSGKIDALSQLVSALERELAATVKALRLR